MLCVHQVISAWGNWQPWLSALEEPTARRKLRVALLVIITATPPLLLVILKHVCVMQDMSQGWWGPIIVTFVV